MLARGGIAVVSEVVLSDWSDWSDLSDLSDWSDWSDRSDRSDKALPSLHDEIPHTMGNVALG
ncbi:hypothetical protein [Prevotella ihumii]|uniref:hypothetical protein n=1 Tax=Prevotella ihumii TaxID=1917878 RepID=UPI0012B54667|nr:hypothetical protein [Prevotella ihumii]